MREPIQTSTPVSTGETDPAVVAAEHANPSVFSVPVVAHDVAPDAVTASTAVTDVNVEVQSGGTKDITVSSSPRKEAGVIPENTNIYKTAFHIFKANVGTAVFLLPVFYQDAGYILGPTIAVLIGVCVIDASQLLLGTKLTIDRPRVDTYGRICKFIFGPPLQWVLFVCLLLSQFGFCLLYMQLTVDTMNTMVQFKGDTYVWSFVMFFIEFGFTCFSSNFSTLAIISISASVAVTFTLVATFVGTCMEINKNGRVHPTVNAFGNNIPIGWFNNMASNLMGLEGIAIVLPAHTGCNQKTRFKFTLSLVLTLTVSIYLLYGITGYLAYGTSINTSIIDGLPESKLSTAVRAMLVINLVCTYPVQFQSAIQAVDQVVGCSAFSVKGILLRLFINLVIVSIELAVGPKAVHAVVSLIGALPAAVMVFILPALLTMQVDHAVMNPEEDRVTLKYWGSMFTAAPVFSWTRIRCYFYIIFGLIVMVMGTYSVIAEL